MQTHSSFIFPAHFALFLSLLPVFCISYIFRDQSHSFTAYTGSISQYISPIYFPKSLSAAVCLPELMCFLGGFCCRGWSISTKVVLNIPSHPMRPNAPKVFNSAGCSTGTGLVVQTATGVRCCGGCS